MSLHFSKFHLVCGYAASGKSTLAQQLARDHGAIVLSEDQWLSALFEEELHSLADYVRCTARLRRALGPHVMALLQAKQAVVMDFAANTVEARAWLVGLAQEASVTPTLHFLDVPQEVCWRRAQARNQAGSHEFQLSKDQFDKLASHFERPDEVEGFDLVLLQSDQV
ncbi:MAG: ATP-binding protein [Shimia sp.]|uniref:AAA family ATPase n=1 Tax=Shimia sp. TaxID=1954381 RepID=UPI0025FEDC87|nr:ATP-binding protein [Shimia sp.]MCH2067490.1 ATP-binding protein [Shimia sp.]